MAKKLGKIPYIYWGKSCFYTDKEVGSNTYLRLFQEPKDHDILDISNRFDVYPDVWMPLDETETIQSIDAKADILRHSHSLEIVSAEAIVKSDLCIIYQYLSSDSAKELASAVGIAVDDSQFIEECNEIFADYFRPHVEYQTLANTLWTNFFSQDDYATVIGMHVRGTDKIIEKAVPSPHHYLQSIRKLGYIKNDSAFFIATDSQPYLAIIQRRLKPYCVAAQNTLRTSGRTGLHYDSQNAFQNAVAMIVDIELLSRCQVVFAYPGSQIYSWLTRKKEAGNLNFKLLPVSPDFLDWLSAGWIVLHLHGWQRFLNFLRFQKPKILQYLKMRLSFKSHH
ncbi:MAG: hypothetical protein VKL42_03455 [Snowella sp.]|nr:hypothetical protein [Snowella sp.]